MSNRELPDISVGDFAMDILKDMAKNPSESLKPALKESTLESVNAPDVSKIEVSNDYVSLVLEGKKPSKKVEVIKESKEDRLQNIVGQLSTLISEAKQLLEEISPGCTTVGNIGVNMAGPSKKLKKKKVAEQSKPNPWAVCHSSVGPEKSSKFERCVMKIKSKYGIKK